MTHWSAGAFSVLPVSILFPTFRYLLCKVRHEKYLKSEGHRAEQSSAEQETSLTGLTGLTCLTVTVHDSNESR